MSKDLERYNHLRYNSQSGADADEFVDFLFQQTEDSPPAIDENEAWNSLKHKLTASESTRKGNFGWLKIAASIAIFFTISFSIYLYTSSAEELYVSSGQEKIEVTFPDGSAGVLNASSSFTYSDRFATERRVAFTGEAYFDVVKDKRPFIIESNGVEIKVLGTAFNLISTDTHVDLYVERGVVAFSKDGKETKVKAGAEASFNRSTNEVIFMDAPSSNVMSWRNGAFVFDETPLEEAFKDLGEYYEVEFKVANQNINNCRISARIEDKSLEEVLALLETILDIKVDLKGSAVKISGQGC